MLTTQLGLCVCLGLEVICGIYDCMKNKHYHAVLNYKMNILGQKFSPDYSTKIESHRLSINDIDVTVVSDSESSLESSRSDDSLPYSDDEFVTIDLNG